MDTSSAFLSNFIKNKRDKEEIKQLISNTSNDEICEAILSNNSEHGFNVYVSAIESLLMNEDKLFEVVKEVLPKLNRDHLSTRVLNDFYSRLCIEIPNTSLRFAVKLAYFCENFIQFGDPRACFFKDLLPCVLQILAKDDRLITFDGVSKSSLEYHQTIITGILNKPFKVSVLTSITSMFKDIPLNKQQTELLLGKICDNIQNVQQQDISGLALACFNLALFNRLIIPMLAFDSYFYNKRYKKKFVEFDSASDIDSIDEIASRGLIETEDNVIFHFQHVTEFTSIEKDIVTALKPLSFAPKFIISPFIATILVTFAKMSSSSVAGNLRLPQSILLPFIKQVFKNNERHRSILQQSAWARSVEQFEPINIEKLLKVLQENTCKLGQNVALNGFIGLTFNLLKTKQAPALNNFAVQFLNELVKQRQEFASDIMKIVVKMLFTEPNKAPIIDCFSIMIQNRALPIDRCEEALTELIENLTELELDTALAIESVIYNAITKSARLRDLMSEKMRAAMYQNKPEMRKLAVYSFCVMLKKVTKQTQGSTHGAYAPSQNISMMSLLSQSQLPSTEKASMRRVSVLVLEILGILRKCFSHNAEIRVMLYENLLSAVAANPFIIPNVLELVETYFRDYFDNEIAESIIDFSKVFKQLEHGEIVVMDHVGKFLSFFVGCLEIASEKLKDENASTPQMSNYRAIVEKLVEKVQDITTDQLNIFSTLDVKTSETITQFINCLEALMVHCSYKLLSKGNVTRFNKLFEKHQMITKEALKLQDNHKKSSKKGKNQTIDAVLKIEINFNSVWDLAECGNFMQLIFEKNANEKVNEIKQNRDFCRFVMKSIAVKIAQLNKAPEHLKVKHSKVTFASIKKYSALMFKQMELSVFEKLFDHFDEESAVFLSEAFKNSILMMDSIYNSSQKWQDFMKKLTETTNETDFMLMEVIKSLQKIVDWAFDPEKDIAADANMEKIVVNVFTAIETLFKNFQTIPNKHVREIYNWLLGLCKSTEINQKNLHIINRALFQIMTQQDGSGIMMEHIANKISSIYGHLEEIEDVENFSQNDLKSIATATVDQSFTHFSSIVKKYLDDIEFCILRMNSFNAHVKIPGQESRHESAIALKKSEQSSVIKLKQLGVVVGRLCNSKFTLRGGQVDQIVKIVIAYFTCLLNLMKHFVQHHEIKKIDLHEIPLEMLMKETKITVKRVYALIPHFEDMADDEQKKAEKEGKKKAVIREVKNMSRLVLTIEKFAAIVQRLDGLTKKKFSKYIHVGEVRGFIIDYSKKTGHKTTSKRSRDLSADDSDITEVTEQDDEEEAQVSRKTTRHYRIEDTSSEEEIDSDETNASSYESPLPVVRGGFEKNLKKIKTKSKQPVAAASKARKRRMP